MFISIARSFSLSMQCSAQSHMLNIDSIRSGIIIISSVSHTGFTFYLNCYCFIKKKNIGLQDFILLIDSF